MSEPLPLLRMLQLLDGKWWTKAELAAELKTSERSVKRYFRHIQNAGWTFLKMPDGNMPTRYTLPDLRL